MRTKVPSRQRKSPVSILDLEVRLVLSVTLVLGCVSKSSDSPNWDAVLYALVESAAMYLR